MEKEFIKATNGYTKIADKLPDAVRTQLLDQNAFSGGGNWLTGVSFYKNDNDYIVVTNNGWYYKVDAEYMVWHVIFHENQHKLVAQAIWSNAALKRTIKSLMKTGTTVNDPDYQT